MKRNWSALLAALVCTFVLAAPARAQVFTPTYMSPVPLNDLGVYLSEGVVGDLALEGIWRGGPLGLRAGFVDADEDDLLTVGAEFRNPLALATAPLGLAVTAGAQGLIGDASAVGLQVGLSAGYRFAQPGLAFTPYIHPRVAFVNGFAENDDFESEILADVGVDLEVPRNLIVRFGIGLSDETADWGVGLAWRR